MRMNRHCVLSMLLAGFASTAVVLAQQATRPAGTTDATDSVRTEIYTGDTDSSAAPAEPADANRPAAGADKTDKNVNQFDDSNAGARSSSGSLNANNKVGSGAGTQSAGTQHQARSANWWSQRYANAESRDRGPNFDDPALWRDQDRGQDAVAETDTRDQNTGGVSSGMVERGTERNRGVFEGSDVDARREYRADRDEFRGREDARNLDDRELNDRRGMDDRSVQGQGRLEDEQRFSDQRRFDEGSARRNMDDDRSAQFDDDRDYQSWRDRDNRGQGMADSRYGRDQGFEGRKHNYGEYRTRFDNHTTAEDYTPWTTNSRDRWNYQTTNETRRPSWSHDYRLVPSRDRDLNRGPNQEYRSRGYSFRGSDRDRDTYRGQEYTRSDDRDRRVDNDRWDDDDRWDADRRDDETGLTYEQQRAARNQARGQADVRASRDSDRRSDSDRWDDDDRWDADQRDDETGLSAQAQREARARDER